MPAFFNLWDVIKSPIIAADRYSLTCYLYKRTSIVAVYFGVRLSITGLILTPSKGRSIGGNETFCFYYRSLSLKKEKRLFQRLGKFNQMHLLEQIFSSGGSVWLHFSMTNPKHPKTTRALQNLEISLNIEFCFVLF